jgi:uncharacterized protein (DUF488 family)
MFYRKKVLLNLLNVFGGRLEKIPFVKLLFLFCIDKEHKYYEFVPYHYGPFSFTAYCDINSLKKDCIIYETDNSFTLQQFDGQLYKITEYDIEQLNSLYKKFKDKNSDILMKFVYEHYPYYAKNSFKYEFLTPKVKNAIKEIIPDDNRTVLFDIGYEGKSLECYLNLLIKNSIKTLIDVRKNPISMKYGFSKNILSKRASDLNIKYVHMPELGIESAKRKLLSSIEDYQKLFDEYENIVLKQNVSSVEQICSFLMQDKRIVLTCFEADSNYCHRSRIVNFMNNSNLYKFETEHL